jgi:hypothetical protein
MARDAAVAAEGRGQIEMGKLANNTWDAQNKLFSGSSNWNNTYPK